MRLYRVFPWLPDAAKAEPGHPLFVSERQGDSRIDNVEHYRVLYASDSPAGAVAEIFGALYPWHPDMFRGPRHLPGSTRALVEYEVDARVIDLDRADALLKRRLKPSFVATRNRLTTQRWALALFRENAFDGIRWWSYHEATWGSIGLWAHEGLAPGRPIPLWQGHPAVLEAAGVLARRWERTPRRAFTSGGEGARP